LRTCASLGPSPSTADDAGEGHHLVVDGHADIGQSSSHAAQHDVDWLTASYLIVIGDHIGTHADSLRRLRDDTPGPEGTPLE
jgi:hypothetical protein